MALSVIEMLPNCWHKHGDAVVGRDVNNRSAVGAELSHLKSRARLVLFCARLYM